MSRVWHGSDDLADAISVQPNSPVQRQSPDASGQLCDVLVWIHAPAAEESLCAPSTQTVAPQVGQALIDRNRQWAVFERRQQAPGDVTTVTEPGLIMRESRRR